MVKILIAATTEILGVENFEVSISGRGFVPASP